MKTPINVKDIWEFAPHRPPMVWVDEVTEYGATQGVCTLRLKADGLYMGEKGFRQSGLLELIAQSYGFISICHREYSGDPVKKVPGRAFLASVKDVSFPDEAAVCALKAGDLLRIEVRGVRRMSSIILFYGEVRFGEKVLCRGQVKVFSEP